MYTTTHAILAAIPLLLAFFLMVLRNVSASKSVGVSFLLTVLLMHFVWQVSTLDTAAYTVYGPAAHRGGSHLPPEHPEKSRAHGRHPQRLPDHLP